MVLLPTRSSTASTLPDSAIRLEVRPLDLSPRGAHRLEHREPVGAAGGGDDLRPGVDRHVERHLAEGRGRPPDDQRLAGGDLEAHSPLRMCNSAWLRPNALTSITA